MRLSIITVNLNNREGLRITIDSVLAQTFKDFEWIVIDGGSTDGSRELIQEYSSHFAFWCSEPDTGIYNAMNKGVSHASGEYCQFLNSGDWLAGERVLEEVFSINRKADICYGNIKRYEGGKYIDSFIFTRDLSLLYLFEQPLGHNASFIKRQLLIDFPYDESLRISSDWYFCINAALHNRTFEFIDIVVGCFDMTGISSSETELVAGEKKRILEEMCPKLLQANLKERKEMEIALAHTKIDYYLSLRKKGGFLGKLHTLSILLMKKFDNDNSK